MGSVSNPEITGVLPKPAGEQLEPPEPAGDQLEPAGDQLEPRKPIGEQLESTEEQLESTGKQLEPPKPAGDQLEPHKPVGDQLKPLKSDEQTLQGTGVCKWFNVRMGFGFLTMTKREGEDLETPVDVFVHQSKLHMDGFRSLKEGESVEFNFKKSSKGLESTRVTGPGGVHCIGSERRPKVKGLQKRRPKGDRCYNCGGLDHHAKECKLPPQPKKCHFCQSPSHMVAQCPAKASQASNLQVKPAPEEQVPSPVGQE
ncbi:protein lin-28 homolog A [Discoglossus pictus]